MPVNNQYNYLRATYGAPISEGIIFNSIVDPYLQPGLPSAYNALDSNLIQLYDYRGSGVDSNILDLIAANNAAAYAGAGSIADMWSNGGIGGIKTDGVDDRIDLDTSFIHANCDYNKAFSAELWVKPEDGKANMMQTALYNDALNVNDNAFTMQIDLRTATKLIKFGLMYSNSVNARVDADVTGLIELTDFNHIVFTFDGSGDYTGMKIGLNGSLLTTTPVGTTTLTSSVWRAGLLATLSLTDAVQHSSAGYLFPSEMTFKKRALYSSVVTGSQMASIYNFENPLIGS